MLLFWDLDDITLVTADDAELTGCLVTLKVFLEHLSITAEVWTFHHEVVALLLVLLEIRVGDRRRAALVSVLALRLNHSQLFCQKWMRVNKSHVW